MGLGCSDESRQKHGKWCALLDGIVAAVWAATPDKTGVTASGTAALNPQLPKTGISAAAYYFNIEMADQGKEGIDPVWAEQHPMAAFRELKRRRGY